MLQSLVKWGVGLLLLMSVSSYAEVLRIWRVGPQTLPFYQKPDTTSKQLSALSKDQVVIGLETQKNWVKLVNPKSGEMGWVSQENLEKGVKMVVTLDQEPRASLARINIKAPQGEGGHTQSWYQAFRSSFSGKPDTSGHLKDWQKRIERQRKAFEEIFDLGFDCPMMYGSHFPIIQPVIIVKEDQALAQQQSVKK